MSGLNEIKSAAPPEPQIHEGCGGIIFFLIDPRKITNERRLRTPPEDIAALPDERICLKCSSKETYAADKFIIVGKPGIPLLVMQNLCENIHKDAEILNDAMRDKNDRRIIALCVYIPISLIEPQNWQYIDIEKWIKLKVGGNNFNKHVLAVFRSPIRRALDKPKTRFK
jgi:hypothetical protein